MARVAPQRCPVPRWAMNSDRHHDGERLAAGRGPYTLNCPIFCLDDGVHLSVPAPDPEMRILLMEALLSICVS